MIGFTIKFRMIAKDSLCSGYSPEDAVIRTQRAMEQAAGLPYDDHSYHFLPLDHSDALDE